MSTAPVISAKRALLQRRAVHLYRNGLKHVLSWAIHRDLFYEEANKLRSEFEALKNEKDEGRIERLVSAGEAKLWANQHPDLYTVPWAYCGSKYARNPPVPEEIHVAHDFGKQEDD